MLSVDQLKKSFADEAAVLFSDADAIAANSLEDALTLLLTLEKKCRIGNDFKTLKDVCLHMVRLCKDNNDWSRLNTT